MAVRDWLNPAVSGWRVSMDGNELEQDAYVGRKVVGSNPGAGK